MMMEEEEEQNMSFAHIVCNCSDVPEILEIVQRVGAQKYKVQYVKSLKELSTQEVQAGELSVMSSSPSSSSSQRGYKIKEIEDEGRHEMEDSDEETEVVTHEEFQHDIDLEMGTMTTPLAKFKEHTWIGKNQHMEKKGSDVTSSSISDSRKSSYSGLTTSSFFDHNHSYKEIQESNAYLTERCRSLERELKEKDAIIKEKEDVITKTNEAGDIVKQQHNQLYDNFVLLRRKYDSLKRTLLSVVWNYIPENVQALSCIPKMNREVEDNGMVIGRYILREHLGEGEFAVVKACYDNQSEKREVYACKIIKKEKILTTSGILRVHNEIYALQSVRHPNIPKCHDVIHTELFLYIIMEKGGKDLFDFFGNHLEGVPESLSSRIIYEILTPVQQCHALNICHRDLKPENILIKTVPNSGEDSNGLPRVEEIKISDFGLSKKVDETGLLYDFCGSPGFFAPEMIIEKEYDGRKADSWSVGCILLELTIGHEDFDAIWMRAYEVKHLQTPSVFHKEIERSVVDIHDSLDGFSLELVDFLTRTLALDPVSRMSIEEMLVHPWILKGIPEARKGVDKVSRLQAKRRSPRRRSMIMVGTRSNRDGVAPASVAPSCSDQLSTEVMDVSMNHATPEDVSTIQSQVESMKTEDQEDSTYTISIEF